MSIKGKCVDCGKAVWFFDKADVELWRGRCRQCAEAERKVSGRNREDEKTAREERQEGE